MLDCYKNQSTFLPNTLVAKYDNTRKLQRALQATVQSVHTLVTGGRKPTYLTSGNIHLKIHKSC